MSFTFEDSDVARIVRYAITNAVHVAMGRTSHSWSSVVPSTDGQDSSLAVDTLIRLPSLSEDDGDERHDASSCGTPQRSSRSRTREANEPHAQTKTERRTMDGYSTIRAKPRSVDENDWGKGHAKRGAHDGGHKGRCAHAGAQKGHKGRGARGGKEYRRAGGGGHEEGHEADGEEELGALMEVLESQLWQLNTYKAKLEAENEALRSWASQPSVSAPSIDFRPFGNRTDLLGAKLLEEQVKKYSLETLVPVLRESIGKLEQRLAHATTRADKLVLKYAYVENSAEKLFDIPLSIKDSKPAATLKVLETTPAVRILGGYMRQAIYDFQVLFWGSCCHSRRSFSRPAFPLLFLFRPGRFTRRHVDKVLGDENEQKERMSKKKRTCIRQRRVLRKADDVHSTIYILSSRMERLAHQAMRQRSEICYINKLNKASKKNACTSQSICHFKNASSGKQFCEAGTE